MSSTQNTPTTSRTVQTRQGSYEAKMKIFIATNKSNNVKHEVRQQDMN